HLPEQPLIDLDAPALVTWIELPGLAPEILQDRPRLEDRDRPATRSCGIDDRRHPVIGRDREKLRRKLLAFGDIDRDDAIGQPALLQHDRDLPAVRGWPVVERDRLAGIGARCSLAPAGGLGPCGLACGAGHSNAPRSHRRRTSKRRFATPAADAPRASARNRRREPAAEASANGRTYPVPGSPPCPCRLESGGARTSVSPTPPVVRSRRCQQREHCPRRSAAAGL